MHFHIFLFSNFQIIVTKFAYRYLASKKSTNAINIIAWVSIAAIALVTAAMIVIMSVFNGLTDLVKSLYNGFYADLKIQPKHGKTITISPDFFQKIKQTQNVATICKIAEEKALIKIGETQTVVTLKGVDSNFTKITSIEKGIIRGAKYDVGDTVKPKLILGLGVESALGILASPLQSGITIYIPNRNQRFTGKIEDFLIGTAQPTATFAVQQDFDNKYVLTNIDFAKTIIGLDSNLVSFLELNVIDKNNLLETQKMLQKNIGDTLQITNRFEQNKSLYSVMRNEKWAAYAILCLVLIIASFTIIGALTMLVLEKKKDIAILKSFGSSNQLIKNIFLTEGVLLGVIGVVLGLILGLLLCFLQEKLKLVPLSGGSFLIDHYPVSVNILDILIIVITVLLITIFAGYFPAKRAANQTLALKN